MGSGGSVIECVRQTYEGVTPRTDDTPRRDVYLIATPIVSGVAYHFAVGVGDDAHYEVSKGEKGEVVINRDRVGDGVKTFVGVSYTHHPCVGFTTKSNQQIFEYNQAYLNNEPYLYTTTDNNCQKYAICLIGYLTDNNYQLPDTVHAQKDFVGVVNFISGSMNLGVSSAANKLK